MASTVRRPNRVAGKLDLRTGNPARSWMDYLELNGKVAFRLFNNGYELVGDLPLERRVALAEILNSFRFHPVTNNWLASLEDDEDRLAAAIAEVV
jgi:hypothetical protein